ncbi:MAG: DUF2075 domain-containing protein [Clostridiales bacterium]|nr:DUF2075 domain-containing protein [Clostridiales bacterium]
MRAVNIYILTRKIKADKRPLYEKALSNRKEEIKTRIEEYELIETIVNNLIFCEASLKIFEYWYYSFSIPQIGKEFDLLKIGKNRIVNIELKSQEVAEEKIIRQLEKNRMYLTHINKEIYSFTYVRYEDGTEKLFRLKDGKLEDASFEKLLQFISLIEEPLQDGIENLFRPNDYMVSPINTPNKFLQGQYYLNNQQSSIKNNIISKIEKGDGLFGITGSAGTGKTLLLYDLAKTLSGSFNVCVIHSGILSDGHKYLNTKLDSVDIIDAKTLTKNIIENYDVVCVDESQRLYTQDMDVLINAFEQKNLRACIFSYDYTQVLSKTELRRNNPERLRKITGFLEQNLKNRVRTNPEILSFVRTLMRVYDVPKNAVDYSNIDVIYANSIQESDRILKIYQSRGYTFISYTPSHYVFNEIDHYSSFMNSYLVIGQEFDNVVQIMDNNFRHSAKGELQGREHPNPDYLFAKLFYQNITRAREKMCIIVLNNEELFDTLLMIKEHRYDELKEKYIKIPHK